MYFFFISFADATSFKSTQNDLPDESFSNANVNDSWDLDLSLPTTSKTKTKTKRIGDDFDADAKFVPAKGQKTVTKRLKQISGK